MCLVPLIELSLNISLCIGGTSMPIAISFYSYNTPPASFCTNKRENHLCNKQIKINKSLDISDSNDPIQIAYSLIKVLSRLMTLFGENKILSAPTNFATYIKCFIYSENKNKIL